MAGECQRALRAAGADIIDMGGAGRTDAGVHAIRQTAHLRLRQPVDAGQLRIAMNDALPHDIHVLSLLAARGAFHARHDAVSRHYLYQISRRRTALAKRHVWWVKRALDAAAMKRAAATIEGRHDFRNFCERPDDQESTIVVVDRAECAVAGDLILVRLSASHFLWKMVRRVVAALVRVGTGELPAGGIPRLIQDPGAGAQVAEWTAPPSGLFMERVVYPGEPTPGPMSPVIPVGSGRDAGLDPESLYLGAPR